MLVRADRDDDPELPWRGSAPFTAEETDRLAGFRHRAPEPLVDDYGAEPRL